MRAGAYLSLALLLAASCSGDPRDFERGEVTSVVQRQGDQLHPDLEGNLLVWFDLEDDPNGACFVPSYSSDGNYDRTCDGKIKVMNLMTGWVRTVSDTIQRETAPVVSGGRVAWRCTGDQGEGLCVTPAERREVTYHPGIARSYYYWYDTNIRPAIDGGIVAWAEYQYQSYETRYRIMRARLDDGAPEAAVYLARYPLEVAVAGDRIAWITQEWDDGYRYRLEVIDTSTDEQTLVLEREQQIFGLAGKGELLSWKQIDPDAVEGEGVHVYYLEADGTAARADSLEARVSSKTGVSLGDDLLVWLDHRDGLYQVAAYDLNSGTEGLLSNEDAVVGAYMLPAADEDWVVWPDLRNGDWDLYLYRF